MTAAERGFLLLCAELGDGQKPLTPAQFRTLRARILSRTAEPEDPDRPLTEADLRALGYDEAFASRLFALISRETELERYLDLAAEQGIHPLTRVSPAYPARLRRLGDLAPAVLFCRGERALLDRPAVALVGSRDLSSTGAAFARRVGELAAPEARTVPPRTPAWPRGVRCSPSWPTSCGSTGRKPDGSSASVSRAGTCP